MRLIIIFFLFTSTLITAQNLKSYVLVSNSSYNYEELENELKELSKNLSQEIDLQNRIYDKENNLICLPLNNDDELYSGSYYPRRHTSNTLSIEYLNYYDKTSPEKLMAIVVMITTNKKEAKEKLLELKKHSASAFLFKADIYIGCMH